MKKRIGGIILALALLLTLAPALGGSARAEAGRKPTELYIGSSPFNGKYYTKILSNGMGLSCSCGGGTAAYNVSSGTLTLEDYRFTDINCYWENKDNTILSYALYCNGDLTILISGTNVLSQQETDPGKRQYGIYVEGNLTIRNVSGKSGTLTTAPGNTSDNEITTSAGIYCTGKLTIEQQSGGTLTVNATGGGASTSSYGVYTPHGFNMVSGTLNAYGGDIVNGSSFGLYAGAPYELVSGSICGKGGNPIGGKTSSSFGAYFIDSSTKLTACNMSGDCVLTGEGGSGKCFNSIGVDFKTGLILDAKCTSVITGTGGTIDGATVSGESTPQSIGVYCGKNGLTADACTAELYGMGGTIEKNSSGDTCGIYTININISGGVFSGTGGDCKGSSSNSRGAYIANTGDKKDYAEFNGGSFTAVGGSVAEDSHSYGIQIQRRNDCKEVNVRNCTITATTKDGDNESKAIYGPNVSLVLNHGAVVTAKCGKSKGYNVGAYLSGVKANWGSVFNVSSGESAKGDTIGLFAIDHLYVYSGTVNASAGDALGKLKSSWGINTKQVLMYDGSLICKGGSATADSSSSYGMYTEGLLVRTDIQNKTMDGATLTAIGGDSSQSYGIVYKAKLDDISVPSGRVVAQGKTLAIKFPDESRTIRTSDTAPIIKGSYNYDGSNLAFSGEISHDWKYTVVDSRESAREVSISGKTLTWRAALPKGETVTAVAAWYDDIGSLLGCATDTFTVSDTVGAKTLTIDEGAAQYKLFLLDSSYAPLCEAWDSSVKEK